MVQRCYGLFFPRYPGISVICFLKEKKNRLHQTLVPKYAQERCSYKIVVWYAWCRFHLKCFSFIIKIYFTCSTVFTCYDFPPSLFIFVSCRLHFKFEHDRTLPICMLCTQCCVYWPPRLGRTPRNTTVLVPQYYLHKKVKIKKICPQKIKKN